MKKVLRPAEIEDAVYYSDMSGKCFGVYPPDAVMTINLYYGSEYDGYKMELHFTDDEFKKIFNLIKPLLKEEKIKDLQETFDTL